MRINENGVYHLSVSDKTFIDEWVHVYQTMGLDGLWDLAYSFDPTDLRLVEEDIWCAIWDEIVKIVLVRFPDADYDGNSYSPTALEYQLFFDLLHQFGCWEFV